MAVEGIMIFGFVDYTSGCLVVLHVERVVFCRVVPVLLANVAKIFGLHELNVLSTVFLSTIVFGVAGRRAFGAPHLLILEV